MRAEAIAQRRRRSREFRPDPQDGASSAPGEILLMPASHSHLRSISRA
jgi:hypothetical protein